MARGLQRDIYRGWPIAPSYTGPNAGGGGQLRDLSQWVQLYTGAQINFGDLTPYLTYGHGQGRYSNPTRPPMSCKPYHTTNMPNHTTYNIAGNSNLPVRIECLTLNFLCLPISMIWSKHQLKNTLGMRIEWFSRRLSCKMHILIVKFR